MKTNGAGTVEVIISGITPLLMRSHPAAGEPEDIKNWTPEQQAEYCSYRDSQTGRLYLPAANLQRAIVSGAAYSKGKGRASLQKSAAAAMFVGPERIDLGLGTFDVDSRWVVNPATGGRIMRHRARLNNWQGTFQLQFDTSLVTENQARRIIDDTGSRVGVLDYRPEKKGPYGRFMVTHWEPK